MSGSLSIVLPVLSLVIRWDELSDGEDRYETTGPLLLDRGMCGEVSLAPILGLNPKKDSLTILKRTALDRPGSIVQRIADGDSSPGHDTLSRRQSAATCVVLFHTNHLSDVIRWVS